MIVRPGSVYRDGDIDYIVAIERINGDRYAVHVRLINIVNWIVLAGHPGTALANGSIDVPTLTGTMIAPNLSTYFKQPRTDHDRSRL